MIGFLSVMIGAIMEDCSPDAISALPEQPDSAILRFEGLTQAGNDIVSLAKAAEVLGSGPINRIPKAALV